MAMHSDKFCLKWDDFQGNITGSFKDLKEDFCDVTLASEGNQKIEAHRVILAAASPLLRDMLRNNKHSHPLLYMRKVQAKALLNIVTFMYRGEVDIFQEDLADFLSLAEELEIKGLTGSDPTPEEDKPIEVKTKQINKHATPYLATPLLQDNKQALTDIVKKYEEVGSESYKSKITAVVPNNQKEKYSSSGTENLTERIYSLIEKRNGVWTCKVCGRTLAKNVPSDISRHAETHIQGLSYTCNQCGTVAKTSMVMANHVSRQHRS